MRNDPVNLVDPTGNFFAIPGSAPFDFTLTLGEGTRFGLPSGFGHCGFFGLTGGNPFVSSCPSGSSIGSIFRDVLDAVFPGAGGLADAVFNPPDIGSFCTGGFVGGAGCSGGLPTLSFDEGDITQVIVNPKTNNPTDLPELILVAGETIDFFAEFIGVFGDPEQVAVVVVAEGSDGSRQISSEGISTVGPNSGRVRVGSVSANPDGVTVVNSTAKIVGSGSPGSSPGEIGTGRGSVAVIARKRASP